MMPMQFWLFQNLEKNEGLSALGRKLDKDKNQIRLEIGNYRQKVKGKNPDIDQFDDYRCKNTNKILANQIPQCMHDQVGIDLRNAKMVQVLHITNCKICKFIQPVCNAFLL